MSVVHSGTSVHQPQCQSRNCPSTATKRGGMSIPVSQSTVMECTTNTTADLKASQQQIQQAVPMNADPGHSTILSTSPPPPQSQQQQGMTSTSSNASHTPPTSAPGITSTATSTIIHTPAGVHSDHYVASSTVTGESALVKGIVGFNTMGLSSPPHVTTPGPMNMDNCTNQNTVLSAAARTLTKNTSPKPFTSTKKTLTPTCAATTTTKGIVSPAIVVPQMHQLAARPPSRETVRIMSPSLENDFANLCKEPLSASKPLRERQLPTSFFVFPSQDHVVNTSCPQSPTRVKPLPITRPIKMITNPGCGGLDGSGDIMTSSTSAPSVSGGATVKAAPKNKKGGVSPGGVNLVHTKLQQNNKLFLPIGIMRSPVKKHVNQSPATLATKALAKKNSAKNKPCGKRRLMGSTTPPMSRPKNTSGRFSVPIMPQQKYKTSPASPASYTTNVTNSGVLATNAAYKRVAPKSNKGSNVAVQPGHVVPASLSKASRSQSLPNLGVLWEEEYGLIQANENSLNVDLLDQMHSDVMMTSLTELKSYEADLSDEWNTIADYGFDDATPRVDDTNMHAVAELGEPPNDIMTAPITSTATNSSSGLMSSFPLGENTQLHMDFNEYDDLIFNVMDQSVH